jgi:hypothetical protein
VSLTSFIWRHRPELPTDAPTFDILDDAAFFPGFKAEDVDYVERLIVDLDLNAHRSWAREITRQAEDLRTLFASKGYHLVGVARADVTDQLRPVWVALLKKVPVFGGTA